MRVARVLIGPGGSSFGDSGRDLLQSRAGVGLGYARAYTVVGLLILRLGWAVLDLLTPTSAGPSFDGCPGLGRLTGALIG
jgi:hypothetical protein